MPAMGALVAECTLCARNGTGMARIKFHRFAQGTRAGLEAAFSDVVVVFTVEVLDMQGQPCRL